MTTSLSLGVTVAGAAVSAGSTVRCGAAASRCVSHAAPTTSAAASSQRFIGIPLFDGPHRKVLQPVMAEPQERCRVLRCFGDDRVVAGTQYSGAYPRCSSAAFARRNTAFHIVRVSLPVFVFCRLG